MTASPADRLRGKFIVFDGPDGGGKETQIERLAAHLADPKSELDKQQVQRLTKLIQEAREKGD